MIFMRLATSPRILQAGRDEKETKLKDFVAAHLTARTANEIEASTNVFTLVVRAPDSPAAKALALLGAEMIAAGVSVRVLLLDTENAGENAAAKSILELANADIRLLNDPRFSAAHEQLVLGNGRIWIGDCMRRDPSKRDAFEMFHADNAVAARHADVSFARMWKIGKPAKRMKPVTTEHVIAGQKVAKAERRQVSRR
jgi:hypothetical protein